MILLVVAVVPVILVVLVVLAIRGILPILSEALVFLHVVLLMMTAVMILTIHIIQHLVLMAILMTHEDIVKFQREQ